MIKSRERRFQKLTTGNQIPPKARWRDAVLCSLEIVLHLLFWFLKLSNACSYTCYIKVYFCVRDIIIHILLQCLFHGHWARRHISFSSFRHFCSFYLPCLLPIYYWINQFKQILILLYIVYSLPNTNNMTLSFWMYTGSTWVGKVTKQWCYNINLILRPRRCVQSRGHIFVEGICILGGSRHTEFDSQA